MLSSISISDCSIPSNKNAMFYCHNLMVFWNFVISTVCLFTIYPVNLLWLFFPGNMPWICNSICRGISLHVLVLNTQPIFCVATLETSEYNCNFSEAVLLWVIVIVALTNVATVTSQFMNSVSFMVYAQMWEEQLTTRIHAQERPINSRRSRSVNLRKMRDVALRSPTWLSILSLYLWLGLHFDR